MPNRIVGLKRTPVNVKDVFAYAFQHDKVTMKANGGDVALPSSHAHNYFLLSLAELLAMVGGYEWNRRGVYIDALQGYIHPHFGVFPPTRQDYMRLVDNITIADRTARHQDRPPIRMMEVGIGTGVLSIILLRRKTVDSVIGTDINPYAVACAEENFRRFGLRADLLLADLFPPPRNATAKGGTIAEKVDVVLFNPPWVPGGVAGWVRVRSRPEPPSPVLDAGTAPYESRRAHLPYTIESWVAFRTFLRTRSARHVPRRQLGARGGPFDQVQGKIGKEKNDQKNGKEITATSGCHWKFERERNHFTLSFACTMQGDRRLKNSVSSKDLYHLSNFPKQFLIHGECQNVLRMPKTAV